MAADDARRPFDLAAGRSSAPTLLRLGAEGTCSCSPCTTSSRTGGAWRCSARAVGAVRGLCGGRRFAAAGAAVQYADFAVWRASGCGARRCTASSLVEGPARRRTGAAIELPRTSPRARGRDGEDGCPPCFRAASKSGSRPWRATRAPRCSWCCWAPSRPSWPATAAATTWWWAPRPPGARAPRPRDSSASSSTRWCCGRSWAATQASTRGAAGARHDAGAYDHQEVPFERLGRSPAGALPGRSPLFQVMSPGRTVEAPAPPGWAVEARAASAGRQVRPHTSPARAAQRGSRPSWSTTRPLRRRDGGADARHLVRLVEQVAGTRSAPLERGASTEAERARVLEEWTGPARPYPSTAASTGWSRRRRSARPSPSPWCHEGARITYAD